MNAEKLNAEVRSVLVKAGSVREVKMFGGVGFMLNGNLAIGASQRGLLVRVGKEGQGAALSRPGAGPMVMRGRTMDGYVRVPGQALDEAAVRSWVELAIAFVRTLPPKAAGAGRKRRSAKSK
jgi:TfoX/Sxy family transcriptional regulator of competence genes